MTRPSDLAALTSRVLDPLAPADRYASDHDVLDSVGALEAEDDLYSGAPDQDVIAVMGDAYGADEFGSLWGSIKRRVKRTAKGAYHVVPKGLRHAAESAADTAAHAATAAGKAALKATDNPVVKWGLRGTAIAFPAVAPGVAALEAGKAYLKTANSVLKAAEQGIGTARASIQATIDAAAKGDSTAQNGLKYLGIAAKARKTARRVTASMKRPGTPGTLITDAGAVLRGRWVTA